MRLTSLRDLATIDPELEKGPMATLFMAAMVSLGPIALYASDALVGLLLVMALLSRMAADTKRQLEDEIPVHHGLPPVRNLALYAIAWLGLSCSWSSDPEAAIFESAPTVLILMAAWLLAISPRQLNYRAHERLARAYVLAVSLLGALMLSELSVAAPLGSLSLLEAVAGGSSNAANILVIAAWPALALLSARAVQPRLGMLLLALVGLALLVSAHIVPLLAYATALFVYGLCRLGQRRIVLIVYILIVPLLIATPWLLSRVQPAQKLLENETRMFTNLQPTLLTWRYIADTTVSSPIQSVIQGHGANSVNRALLSDQARTWLSAQQSNDFSAAPADSIKHAKGLSPLFTRSPNLILQLWFEQGLIGLGLWVLWLAALLAGILRGPLAGARRVIDSGLAALAAFVVISGLSVDLYDIWWPAGAAITAFAWQIALYVSLAGQTQRPATEGS